MTPRPSRTAGFTLIEMTVILAVIAILAAAITPMVLQQLVDARMETTRRTAKLLHEAIVGRPDVAGSFGFYGDMGRWPKTFQELLTPEPGAFLFNTDTFRNVGMGWKGPYINAGDSKEGMLTDAFGNPIPGQEITFVDATGRSQAQGATAISDAAGRAGVSAWTIAREPGSYTLQARGPGFTTTNFVAFGIPALVEVSTGDNQSANAGTLVNTAPALRALDDLNQPLAGVGVTFTVSGGAGRLNGTPAVKTNASGIATAECGSTSPCFRTSAAWASWATNARTRTRSSSARWPRQTP